MGLCHYSRAAFITFSSMTVPRFGQETHKTTTHMGKIRQVRSAIRGWNTERFASRRFASKRYTRDEDDSEDAFAGRIWRGSRT